MPGQGPLVPPQGPLVQGPITGMGACPRAAPCGPISGLREAAAVPLTNRCATPSSSSFSAGSLASLAAPATATSTMSPAIGQPAAAREPLPLSSAPDARAVSTEAIAGMDMIGELFQQQAKRLEVQLYQQLRDRKQIEMVNVQLQQNVQQLQQLQQQNTVQSRLIEANEQSLHVMYEQARTIHSERNTVVALCERLAADAHALRQSLAQENPRRYGHLESIPLTQVPKTRFDLPPISALFSQKASLAAQGVVQGALPLAGSAAVSAAAAAVDPATAVPGLPTDLNSSTAPAVPAPAAPGAPPSATAELVTAAPAQPSGGEAAEHEVTASEVKMEEAKVDVKVDNAPPEASAGPQQTSLALLSAVASHSSASRPNLTAKPHRGPNGSDEHSTSGDSGSSGSGGRRNKQATASFPTLDSSVSGNSGSNGSGSGSGSGSNGSGSGSNDGSDCAEDGSVEGDSNGSDSGNGNLEGDSNGSDSGNGNGDSVEADSNGSDHGNGSDNGNGNGDSAGDSVGDSANGEGSDSGSNGINAGSGSDHGDHGDGSDSSHGEGGELAEGEGSDSGNTGSSLSAHDDGAAPRKRAPRGKQSANPGATATKRRRQ